MRRPVPAAVLGTLALLALAAPPAGAQAVPGRELILPPSEVRDTFFAWLVGVVDAGRDAAIDNAGLREVLTEFRSSIALPFDRIVAVRHGPRANGRGKPGDRVRRRDRHPRALLGAVVPPRLAQVDPHAALRRAPLSALPAGRGTAAPVYSFRLVEGAMMIDVDAWLDVLLGNVVDDLSVRLVAIARWRGSWRCLLGGTGREDRRIIAAFDLARNTITFPVPKELVRLGLWLWNAR